MDYGPFGFIDKYDPQFAKWVGSGDHFAFMNQPGAAVANLLTLAGALEPALDGAGKRALAEKKEAAKRTVKKEVDNMWCRKLGLASFSQEGLELFQALEELMRESQADYTVLFRQLAEVPEASAGGAPVLVPLEAAFYKPLTADLRSKWESWLRRWMAALGTEGGVAAVKARMASTNPKYILREYMLVDAYKAAQKGDYALVHELYELIRRPYDEQAKFESKYYRQAPGCPLAARGTAVMT